MFSLVINVMGHAPPTPQPHFTAPEVLWNFTALDDSAALNYSADDSAAFVFAIANSRLTARSMRSGALKWNVSIATSNDLFSMVRLGANSVFALVTADAHVAAKQITTLSAFESGDGTSRWKKRIDQPCEYTGRLLAAVRGLLFTTLCYRNTKSVIQNVTLLALSEADGTTLWSKGFPAVPGRTTTDDPIGGFHVVNDTLYVLNDQGLTAHDVLTGQQRWQRLGAIGPLDFHPSQSTLRTASLFTEGIRAEETPYSPAYPPPSSRTVYTITSERTNTTWPCGFSSCTLRSVRLVGIDHASGKDVFSVPVPDSLSSQGETAVAYVNVNQSYAVAGSWEGAPYFVVAYDRPNPGGSQAPSRASQILHLNHSGAVLGRFELQRGGVDAVYPWSARQPVAHFQYSVPLLDDGPDRDLTRSYTGAFLPRGYPQQHTTDPVQVHGQSCVMMLASEPPPSASRQGWQCPAPGPKLPSSPCHKIPSEPPQLLLRTKHILSGVHGAPNAGDSFWDLLLPPDVHYVGLRIPPAENYCTPIPGMPILDCAPGSIAAVLYSKIDMFGYTTYTVVGWK